MHRAVQDTCNTNTVSNLQQINGIHLFFRDMYKRFSAIFTITENPAKVVIPETFATKVKGWLGGNEKLFNNVKDQVCTYFYKNIHLYLLIP